MIKKLLSLAAILLVSVPALVAQTFEFRYHGESLADGATVTIQAEEDEWGFGWSCYTNPSYDANNGLVLKLLSSSQAQVSVATLTINENTLNPTVLSWCMGGNCMYFGNKTSLTKEDFSVNNGSENVQFDAENIQSEGYLFATLTATIGGETHMVNIKFTYGEQGDDAAFEFRYKGEPLADGATVIIPAEEDEDGVLTCVTNPSSDTNDGLVLQLLSGNFSGGVATMTINENALIYDKLIWCMSGYCVDFGDNTSLTCTFPFIDNIARVLFECIDIQSEGYLSATLTAAVGGVTHTINIKFTYNEQPAIPGDVNGDGTVTSVDVTALYNYLLNGDSSHMVNGDQDGDGSITSVDITIIYNILLGN